MEFKNGANIDTRPESEKLKDFRFGEIVSATNPVNWIQKPEIEWRTFPIYNQNGSGSCVAQTMAKLLGIIYWLKNKDYVHFSATHIYQRRINKPAGGMNGVDAFEIARAGVTLEELTPSQNMNDEVMDAVEIQQYKKDVGEIFKIGNYVQPAIKSIDTIASIIQTTGKGVMVWFYFQANEWTGEPAINNPDLDLNGPDTIRHSVAAVDFTLYGGKKALIIEDSWGVNYGYKGQRVITEEFFKARNWFAAYPINFKFEDQVLQMPKPKYIFNKDLQFGQKNDDITALQNILKFNGMFPTNAESTGYFGAITKEGVQKFQIQWGIVSPEDAGYGRVGPKTRTILNRLFS